MVLTWKCCVKGTSMLMSSPKMVILRVKVIPGMKQKLFSFTQAMLVGWSMQGGQTNQGELFIALTRDLLKAGNSVLLAAKMVIKNPEEVNAATGNGKQSKE